jgi:hypothetical protein
VAAGLDLSEAAVARAGAEQPGAVFLRADVRRLPCRGHRFDAALAGPALTGPRTDWPPH